MSTNVTDLRVSTNVQARERLEFIDVHRGLAVLLMLWMHTADGWLRPGLKAGAGWNLIRGLGGFAAPSFLLLAGLSLGLGWGIRDAAGSPRSEVARGLGLVVLGYVLRLQMWMLDAGGVRRPEAWAGALPLGLGLLAAYQGLLLWERRSTQARWLVLAAIALTTLGLTIIAKWVPGRVQPLLRVDVLQAIGASLVVVSLVGPALRKFATLGPLLAASVGLATPWLRAWVPGPLPAAIAGYVAQWDAPPGQLIPTLFPLFPWLAYALFGASLGLGLGRAQRRGESAVGLWLRWTGLGVVLALVCSEPLRPAHMLVKTFPWTLYLVRVGYRVGVTLVLGALAIALSRPRVPLRGGLVTLGRASLFVYWVHLEFAFGVTARPMLHRFGFLRWGVGLCVLAVAMTLLAEGWLKLRARRRQPRAEPVGAPAGIPGN